MFLRLNFSPKHVKFILSYSHTDAYVVVGFKNMLHPTQSSEGMKKKIKINIVRVNIMRNAFSTNMSYKDLYGFYVLFQKRFEFNLFSTLVVVSLMHLMCIHYSLYKY